MNWTELLVLTEANERLTGPVHDSDRVVKAALIMKRFRSLWAGSGSSEIRL